jgi:hypothetical protein
LPRQSKGAMRVSVCFLTLTLTLIAPAAPLFGANPLGDESSRIRGKATEKGAAQQYSEDPRHTLLALGRIEP